MKKNILHRVAFILAFGLFSYSAIAQNIAINPTGAAPDNSAMLDVSSSTQGVLIPRMTAADRMSIANPANGLLIYQVGLDSGFYFNGGTALSPNWLKLNSQADTSNMVQDADSDTRIETEAFADEDVIRFSTDGTEYFIMENGRLNVVNTGSSVFLGDRAGANDDLSSNSSTFIGSFAGNQLTTGFGNTAIGSNALANVTTQGSNTAVGFNALSSNTGIENTAIGYNSLGANTSNANVAMGYFSLNSNVLGSENVAIGYDALRSNLGSRNIALGYQAGANETGSDKLYIENSNSVNPLIYGDFANDSVIVNGAFSVARNYTFPLAAPMNSGDVLQYNGTNLVWGAGGGANLSSVLAAGKDAGNDSIVNLNAMTIGSPRASRTSLEIDSFYVVQGKPFNGFRWTGFNAYYDGVSANPQYLNDGYADIMAQGGGKLLLAHWGSSTAGSILPSNALTSIELEDSSLSIYGEATNFEVYIEGSVGVGTSVPSGKLEVAGDGSLIGGLRVSGTTATTVGTSIYLDGANQDWTITGTNNSASSGANKLVFRDYTNAEDLMTIDNAGDVGIGTTNPNSLLHLHATTSSGNLRLTSTSTGTNTTDGFSISNNGTTRLSMRQHENADWQFLTYLGTTAMTIDPTANVGIGTTAPSSQLEVVGDVEIPATNSYTYSSAKTHYQSYAPTSFRALNPESYDLSTSNAVTLYTYFKNGGGALGYATAAVNLPDGAEVTELEAWIYDDDTNFPVRVRLMRLEFGTVLAPVRLTMATVESATANASTSVQNLTTNTIASSTIDNENYAYFLWFSGGDNTQDTRLYGTKITYTVTETD